MQAIVQTEYGSPDVLHLEQVDRPVVSDHGVLIRVQASSVNAGDWHLMRGTPFFIRLIFGGLRQPKIKTLGSDVAGRVVAVGKEVTQFQPGDEVFGNLSEDGFGAFAEYVCAAETTLVHKPANISLAAAAAVPGAGLAALQALRDVGQVQPGQKVLINGASGGVGSFAVQIAKAFGAEVTAVCSPQKLAMVQSLSPDHVIDYTQTDITQPGQRYDLILDAAAYRSVFDYLPALTPGGTYVLIGGSMTHFLITMLLGPWIARTSRHRVTCLEQKTSQADLTTLKELLETEKIRPYIDRCYPLSEVPAAIRYVEQRQVKGKVVISEAGA
ncbi:alcohol dehydrogenase [filamentous cyanobacterium CCP3]|nr:alcohol dehydrogenase [filamentous cyanobacterium CCP3]